MPIFYSPDLSEASIQIVLSENEYRHIKNTLRKIPGDTLDVTNGNGLLASCEIKDTRDRHIILHVRDIEHKEKTHPHIALAFALLKQHNDLIIEKCTELGVYEFYPFYAKRNVKDSLSYHQLERLRKISISAIKQCDSVYLPKIHNPMPFKQLIQNVPDNYLPILAWEEEDQQGLHEVLENTKKDICLIIGPEGGFEEGEVDFARKHSAQIVSLGNHILRAETASITFAAQAIFYQLEKNKKFY